MEVIPAINCGDAACVVARLSLAGTLGVRWVHLDVGDGTFTPSVTWNEPRTLRNLQQTAEAAKLLVEVHLMVANPAACVRPWLEAGAKRVIVHVETIGTPGPIQTLCASFGATLMFSGKLETAVRSVATLVGEHGLAQVLAVNPGPSGQAFRAEAVDRLRQLRSLCPDATIEVDGGMNLETAKLVKEAGADAIAVGSFLFGSSDPNGVIDSFNEL